MLMERLRSLKVFFQDGLKWIIQLDFPFNVGMPVATYLVDILLVWALVEPFCQDPGHAAQFLVIRNLPWELW